jgi:hypothetical protein
MWQYSLICYFEEMFYYIPIWNSTKNDNCFMSFIWGSPHSRKETSLYDGFFLGKEHTLRKSGAKNEWNIKLHWHIRFSIINHSPVLIPSLCPLFCSLPCLVPYRWSNFWLINIKTIHRKYWLCNYFLKLIWFYNDRYSIEYSAYISVSYQYNDLVKTVLHHAIDLNIKKPISIMEVSTLIHRLIILQGLLISSTIDCKFCINDALKCG